MSGPHPKSHVTFQYHGHVTNKKCYISTFTRPIDPKLSRLVTQDEGTSPTKSRDTSITWSCDKSKTLYLYIHKAYEPKLSRVVSQDEGPNPQCHETLRHRGHLTNKKRYISTFIQCMDPKRKIHKLSRMVTRMRRPNPTCHVPSRPRHHATTIQQVGSVHLFHNYGNTENVQLVYRKFLR